MATFSKILFENSFACGMAEYLTSHPLRGDNRISLTISIDGQPTQALIDTGSPWSIIDPRLAGLLETAMQDAYAPTEKMWTSWGEIEGKIIQVNIGLLADDGDSLEFSAMVLVPIINADAEWHQPNFIGVQHFLDRLRFAVDPLENAFYFGLI